MQLRIPYDSKSAEPSRSHLRCGRGCSECRSRVKVLLPQPEISSHGSWLSGLGLGGWAEMTLQALAAAALPTAEAIVEAHLCFHFLPEPPLAYKAAIGTLGGGVFSYGQFQAILHCG